MIPKKIHYVWLSSGAKPPLIKKCMDSWKRLLPGYEIKCWDTANFDINAIPFTREAFKARQWAAAADYIRLYALFNEGGIYLDSDVLVRRSFDPLLQHDFFTGIEYHDQIVASQDMSLYLTVDGMPVKPGAAIPGIGIQAAIMGSIPAHPFTAKCMDWYEKQNFLLPDGSRNNDLIIAPAVFAIEAEKYGFRYLNQMQTLQHNMVIYPSEYFTPSANTQIAPQSYAVHCCTGSWRKKPLRVRVKNKIKNILGICRI